MSWPRQGSQSSLEKPKLMEDQQESHEEVWDFMGFGSCMPREAWRLPSPQPLQWVLVALVMRPAGGGVADGGG